MKIKFKFKFILPFFLTDTILNILKTEKRTTHNRRRGKPGRSKKREEKQDQEQLSPLIQVLKSTTTTS